MQHAVEGQSSSRLIHHEQRWELISLILILRLRGEEPTQIERFLEELDHNLNDYCRELLTVLKESVGDSSLLWGCLKEDLGSNLGAQEKFSALESSVSQLEQGWKLNDKELEEVTLQYNASGKAEEEIRKSYKRDRNDEDAVEYEDKSEYLQADSKISRPEYSQDFSQVKPLQPKEHSVGVEERPCKEFSVNIINTDDGCGFTTSGPLAINLPTCKTAMTEEKGEEPSPRNTSSMEILHSKDENVDLRDSKGASNPPVTSKPAPAEEKTSVGPVGAVTSIADSTAAESAVKAEILRKMLMEKRAAIKNFKNSISCEANRESGTQRNKAESLNTVTQPHNNQEENQSSSSNDTEGSSAHSNTKQKVTKQQAQPSLDTKQPSPHAESSIPKKLKVKHASKHLADLKGKKYKLKIKKLDKPVQIAQAKADSETPASKTVELEDGEIRDSSELGKQKLPTPALPQKPPPKSEASITAPQGPSELNTAVQEQGDKVYRKTVERGGGGVGKYYPPRAQAQGYHDFKYEKGYNSHSMYPQTALQQRHMGPKRYHLRKNQQKFGDGPKQFCGIQQQQPFDVRPQRSQSSCIRNEGAMINQEYSGMYGGYGQNMPYADQQGQAYKYYIPPQDSHSSNTLKNSFPPGGGSTDINIDPQTALKASLISILSKAQYKKPQPGSEEMYHSPAQMVPVQQNHYSWPRDWNQLAQSIRPTQQIRQHAGNYGQAMPPMQPSHMDYYQPPVVQTPTPNVSTHRQNIYTQNVAPPPSDGDYQTIGGQSLVTYGNEYHQ